MAPTARAKKRLAEPARRLQAGHMPLHRQLFLVLRDQIHRGALVAGAALPTEHVRCEQYGVSRITVRRALQDLSAGGLVERAHGRGSFVLAQTTGNRPVPAALTLLDGLSKAQMETSVEVVDLGLRTPPPHVAAALGSVAAGEALYVLRVRISGDEPLMLTEAWLPARFAEILTVERLERRALFKLIRDSGITLGRVVQEITAEIADPVRARLLQTHIGAAVLRVNRLVHDASGSPIQHLSIFLSPDRSRILTDVSATDLDTVATGFLAHDVPRTKGRDRL